MLTDTTALVTGASRGIGREIAIVLAEYGANVALAARSDGIEETERLIDRPDRTLPVRTDVTDEDSVRGSVERTVEAFGGLDCLVNNAGISLVSEGKGGPLSTLDVADWRRVYETNVLGTVICSKHAIPALEESDHGSIVNIASTAGRRPYPNGTAYGASKASMISLGRSLAVELGDAGVRANTVCPGGVQSPSGDRFERAVEAYAAEAGRSHEEQRERMLDRQAIGRFVQARDVAELVAFLASDRARMITGQAVNISGGMVMH